LDPDCSHQLILFAFFLLLAGFFATWEYALKSLNKLRLQQTETETDPRVDLVNKIIEMPEQVFNTLLFGRLVAGITSVVLGTRLILNLDGSKGEGWGLVSFTVALMLVFMLVGKSLPEVLGKKYALGISLFFSRSILFFKYLFFPFMKLFDLLEEFFSSVVGLEKSERLGNGLTEAEIFDLVASGQEDGTINQVEKTMLHGVFEFTDMVVKDVMTPRPDITAVEKQTTYEDLMRVIKEEQFSRIPVYDGTVDNILGVVHIKDLIFLLPEERRDFSPERHVRQTIFVPETKKISELFISMKKEKIHMAIVLDEYGSTAGLVTLEDLIEEIMGDIQDEHDSEEPLLQYIDQDIIEINASMRIEELNELLGLNLQYEEADTVGGLVFAVLDRVPVEGDVVEIAELAFTVWEMEGHRIEKLRLEKLEKTEEPEERQETTANMNMNVNVDIEIEAKTEALAK
jgi:putative hemolysin